MKKITLATRARTEFIDITAKVASAVRESGMSDGVCHIFVPHTTAGLTINENADPSVVADILRALEAAVPFEGPYAHREGNSAAHIKSTLVGVAATVAVTGSSLALGTWQGIFFCEFDGPRARTVYVQTIPR